jgi:hypothetical protein
MRLRIESALIATALMALPVESSFFVTGLLGASAAQAQYRGSYRSVGHARQPYGGHGHSSRPHSVYRIQSGLSSSMPVPGYMPPPLIDYRGPYRGTAIRGKGSIGRLKPSDPFIYYGRGTYRTHPNDPALRESNRKWRNAPRRPDTRIINPTPVISIRG